MIYKARTSLHEATKGTGLKILTPKQMLQRLSLTLAQAKAGNNSGDQKNYYSLIQKFNY